MALSDAILLSDRVRRKMTSMYAIIEEFSSLQEDDTVIIRDMYFNATANEDTVDGPRGRIASLQIQYGKIDALTGLPWQVAWWRCYYHG